MFSAKQIKFVVLALSALALGCQDKSLDDYNKEQSAKQLAQAQAAAGTFRGLNTTQGANASTNAIEIVLYASQVPVQNGTNTGNVVRSVLLGSVSITTGSVVSSAVITNASFSPSDDSNTRGNITGTMTVQLGSGGTGSTTATYNLNAMLDGNSLSGVIAPSDRSGVPGNFSAQRDASLPHVGQGSQDPNGAQPNKYYEGSYENKRCQDPQFKDSIFCRGVDPLHSPVAMTLNYSPASNGYAFVNLFSSVKTLQVQLTFGRTVISLAGADVDDRSGAIHFRGAAVGDVAATTYNCIARGSGYSCEYRQETLGTSYTFELAQVTHP